MPVISFGHSATSTAAPQSQSLDTFNDLCSWLNEQPAAPPTKEAGIPWWSPAQFAPAARKGQKPSWSFLVLDFDGGRPPASLRPYECVAYESRNSTDQAERWRVAVRTLEPIPAQDVPRVVALFAGSDTKAALPTQVFFHRKHNTLAQYHAGKPLDWGAALDLIGDDAPVVQTPMASLTESASVARVRELLKHHDPSADYNDWINVGMALHHELGDAGQVLFDEWSSTSPKYKGAQDIESHWRSFNHDHPNPITLASLRVEQVASAADFDAVSSLTPASHEVNRFTPQPWPEFSKGRPLEWLVQGIIPRAEVVVLYGESGSGKTFLMYDMVAAIARGVPWFGRRVKQGPVVIVCAEGQAGFRQRIRAYAHQYAIKDFTEMPVRVIADVPNLLEGDQALDLARAIAAVGASVIVIDTLSATTPGGNENSGEDIGKVIAHCKGLHRATGAVVILVHHSGKDATKGARGWSGLRAAADAELEVTTMGESRTVRVSKSKDGDDNAQFGFKLMPVSLGENEFGEEITSCVVVQGEIAVKGPKPKKLGDIEEIVLRAIRDLIPPQGGGVAVGVLLTAVREQLPSDPAKRDRRAEYVERAVRSLAADELVVIHNNVVMLA